MIQHPTKLLFIQHGLTDKVDAFYALARQLPTSGMAVHIPQLNRLQTLLHFGATLTALDTLITPLLKAHPGQPIYLIGHSMGGLLWLELLKRHPEWLPRVEKFVLIATPVTGAGLARGVDRYAGGVGVAPDLAQNRRASAEAIAQKIPTLVLAGANDWVVLPRETQIATAKWICLPGLNHATIRDHPETARLISRFWDGTLES